MREKPKAKPPHALNEGGPADSRSSAMAKFLLASETYRRAFFDLLFAALRGDTAAWHAADLARDLWPEIVPQDFTQSRSPRTG